MKAPTFVAAATLTLAVVSAAPQQQPRPTGLIVGHVVDSASGAPVPGAVVMLASTTPAGGFRVATDADGGFLFTGLSAATYTLSVTKPGYGAGAFGQRRPGGEFRLIELADGQRLADVKLLLWKHGSISGAVTDEAGEPVVGVSVRALRWAALAGRRRLVNEGNALTDDRGVYRIASLMPGDYVTMLPATHSTVPVTVYDQYWSDPSNTELRSAIFGALQAITPPGSPQSRQFGEVVLIGAAQGVVPPDPSANGLFLVVPTTFHPGAVTPAQAGTVVLGPGEHKAGADIRLAPALTARVTGTLMGPGGPMSLFPVRLIPRWADDFAGETGVEAASTLTDATGNVTFIGVTPGAYVVRATKVPRPGAVPPGSVAEPSLWAFETVTVGSQDANVRLTLRPGLRVTGRFEFDGTAPRPTAERLRQIPVMIEPVDARPVGTPPAPRPPDSDSTFGTAGVPPGRYFIRIGGPPAGWVMKSVTHEGRDLSETAVELKDDDLTGVVITFTDRPTEIRGRVRGADGAPDDTATVLIFPTDPEAWVDFGLNSGKLRSARADAGSRFTLRVLPGDYYVVAIPEESTPGWRDPKVLEPLSRHATRVRLFAGDAKVVDLTTVR